MHFFWWHNQKSSKISVVPTGWTLYKTKSERKLDNSRYELLSLGIWNELLKSYKNTWIDLRSPNPWDIDFSGTVSMEFIPWDSMDYLLSGNKVYPHDFSPNEIRRIFAYNLWALLRIKETEWLIHWDFQLRHLIHPLDTVWLAVIDVENSYTTDDKWVVNNENTRLLDQVNKSFSNPTGKLIQSMNDWLEAWYYNSNSWFTSRIWFIIEWKREKFADIIDSFKK